MQQASKMHPSQVKGLTWNEASIAITTLDFIIILNTLDCKSITLTYRMDGHILIASRGIFSSKFLTSSKWDLINIKWRMKFSSTSI
jgi:hypothetical protein